MVRRKASTLAAAALVVALHALGGVAAAAAQTWPPIAEGATVPSISGRWVWAELLTRDVAAARAFYGKVFGWTFETHGPAGTADSYTRVLANGRAIGGMLAPANTDKFPGARWIGLVSTPDPAAVAERVRTLGGAVLLAPRTLAGRGELALLADPQGAQFAVIRSATGDPADFAGRENEWLWVELWAGDAARAAAFYKDVFGYGVTAVEHKTAPRSFVLSAGGRARAGVMGKLDAAAPSEWIPHVRVRSVSETVARAQAAGARVLVGATPHHRSSFAVLADPAGALFAVTEWKPQ